jgi:hypothetical protein
MQSICALKRITVLTFLLLIFSALNIKAENIACENHLPALFLQDAVPDSIAFPDQFSIALVSIAEKEGKPQKYYLIGVEGAALYALNYVDFYEQYSSGCKKEDLKRIAFKNLKYVKVLDIFTFSQDKMGTNPYYSKEVGNRMMNIVFKGFGLSMLFGFSMDVWLSSILEVSASVFPVFTLSAAAIGLGYSLLGAVIKLLMDYSGKFGTFKNDHMVQREGFSFKYDFRYGNSAFNRRAMQTISYTSLNR